MKENNENRKLYTKAEMEKLFDWITKSRYSHEMLKETIKKRNDKKRSKQKIHALQKSRE
jgi:hypothetical protein